WRFTTGPTWLQVYADDERIMPTVDPYRRERTIGLGAAIENAVIAAPAKGLRPTLTILPDGPESDLAARIDVVADRVELTPLAEAIAERRTNRGPYRSEAVDPALLAELAGLAGPADAGTGVRWVTDDGSRQALGELLVDAAQAIVDDDAMSRDGYSWFRPSTSAADAHRDGLTVDGQGLAAPLRAVAKLVPSMTSRSLSDATWVKQTRNVHTKTAAAYGVVLVDDPYDRAHQLAGGRLAQRVHLTATTKGLALQHMNQITERIDRDRRSDLPGDYPARLAGIVGDDAARVLCIFRVGWPARPGKPSPRRAAHQVVNHE
ncbi:MAG TPA: hypothetical protein VIU11_08030, partial [Nakamurella sp.]